MFHELHLNAEQTRLHQTELQEMAQRMNRENESVSGSPVLSALGKQLVNLGERLQNTAHVSEPRTLRLQTK